VWVKRPEHEATAKVNNTWK